MPGSGVKDHVLLVWMAGERRWCCAVVSRVFRRVEVAAHAVLLAGGHVSYLIVDADDVETSEARAAVEPPPVEGVSDVIMRAVFEGRPVSIDIPDIEIN